MKRGLPQSAALAGWLFADLLLGLAMVFLASTPADIRAEPTIQPTAESLEESPTPAPPTPVCERSLSTELVRAAIPNEPTPAIPTVDTIRNALGQIAHSRVGLALVYVHAPNDGEGQLMAPAVGQRLREALPDVFTDTTLFLPFDWKDGNRSQLGKVELELFYEQETCS